MRKPVENLINAIVLQAVVDWQHAQKKLKKVPDDPQSKRLIADIESFFLSEWFTFLTGIDGETLLNRLKNGGIHVQREKL